MESNRKKQSSHRDVIVVGAGMAGLLTAYYLKEQGKNVLVLEADEVASGQTERTTAKITSQHGLKYNNLINTVGKYKAKLYAQANERAIREYERLIQEKNISCQFERVSSYLYSRKNITLLKKEMEAAKTLGIDAYFTSNTELPFPVAGALCFRNQAQFNPISFVREIAKELEIWEHTRVIRIQGNRVYTKEGVLFADKIVLAGHYPFINAPGFYFLRQHQERSYVLALSGRKKIKGIYYGIDRDGLSFRQAGDYLLLGDSSHRTGKNTKGGAYDRLIRAANKYFPNCREKARWSAQDCLPHDGIPFIGRFSIFTPHLYVITGFQKWGMTSSMVAAMILRDELCGRRNPFAEVFSPQRCNVRAGFQNLCMDIGESVKGIGRGLFCHKAPRCPHLGCELVWNPDEKSWDCPCHGSRFDVNGKRLDGPAEIGLHSK